MRSSIDKMRSDMEREEQNLPLNIHEIFTSVEGEGPSVGTPTLFIRTAGCDFKCPFCDTKESWTGEFSDTVGSVMHRARIAVYGTSIKRVSITGGNPCLQPNAVASLIGQLQKEGRIFNIEHPGTLEEATCSCHTRDSFIDACASKLAPGNRLSVSLDIKFPLWDKRKDPVLRLQAHSNIIKSCLFSTNNVSTSVKVLVQSKEDLKMLLDYEEFFAELFQRPQTSWFIGQVRNNDDSTDAELTKAVAHSIVHDLWGPWRINPNLHVQLGLK